MDMNLATLPARVVNRPNRQKMFEGKKLEELIEFLDRPGETYSSAAAHFKCSPSTISHRIQALKREAAASDTGERLGTRGATERLPDDAR